MLDIIWCVAVKIGLDIPWCNGYWILNDMMDMPWYDGYAMIRWIWNDMMDIEWCDEY